jgi:4-diphosphocytidyl-2-C-methyl-D-erythritol kinase
VPFRSTAGQVAAVTVRVPAKVNLGLAVGPRGPDGFHELETIFAAIDLYDTVTVTPADQVSLVLTGPEADGLPADRTNLAWRAAEQLRAQVAITVDKHIPVAAGLAGGSADAAGVLRGCLQLRAGPALGPIAARLGSDVTFALHGGLAVGRGRGERLQPLDGPPLHWVLAASAEGLSTPAGYAELDRIRPQAPPPVLDPQLIAAVEHGDPQVLAPLLRNDLQPAALNLAPYLADTLAAGAEAGALAGLVSGSGPTCIFLAGDRRHAETLAQALGRHCRFARPVTTGAHSEIVMKD